MRVAGRACLVVPRIDQVLVIVHIHGVLLRTVDDVGYSKALHHDPMMVAVVVDDKDALAFLVVRGDEPPRMTETLGRELGDGSFGRGHGV